MKWNEFIFDFNDGVQILAPPKSRKLKYTVTDMSGKRGVFRGELDRDENLWTVGRVNYKMYVPWRVELETEDGEKLVHDLDLTGKPVLIDLSKGALGDSVAWMPAAAEFHRKWGGMTWVCLRKEWCCLYRGVYPELMIITPDEANEIKAQDTYARYTVAVCGYEVSEFYECVDFRRNNLLLHADMILGVDSGGKPPKIGLPFTPHWHGNDSREIYIATRASRKCKEWNNPGGWDRLVKELTDRGFRVICIDADNQNLPFRTIDRTGKTALINRAEDLKGARLFIGLPSGLSWLAWACGVPVVLISGFTDVVRPEAERLRYPEFDTPWRVSAPEGCCRNCWMDCDQRETKRFDGCYWHKNNECTREITPEMVLREVDKALESTEREWK